MSTLRTAVVVMMAVFLLPSSARAAALEVTQAAPRGEIASLQEASEVRVVFSEPMVALGRTSEVQAPWFRIEPALAGSLRWAGTRTLVFAPKDPDDLPFATRFEVTIGADATSAAGTRLGSAHRFSFTTPTVRLLDASWTRKGDRYDGPAVLFLRFNQPVSPEVVAKHVALALQPHDFDAPLPPGPASALSAAGPTALSDFEAKVARARAAAGSRETVPFHPAKQWDKKARPPSDDLVVLETDAAPPTDGWIQLRVDEAVAGRQGRETPGKTQEHTIKMERTLFVTAMRCSAACDPDSYNPVKLTARVAARRFRGAVKVVDVTDPAHPKPLTRTAAPAAAQDEEAEGGDDEEQEDAYDRASDLTLPDAGYALAPARSYQVVVDRGLVASDGQTLGYTWIGRVENWHQAAFTSFGGGHGVWESSGGPVLPFSARNLQTVTQWVAPLAVDDLMPTILKLQDKSFNLAPPTDGVVRKLAPRADAIQAHGLDLKPVLAATGTGLAWAGLQDGRAIARAHHREDPPATSSLIQVTNLGISVKDSPDSTLVLVTRLDDARPVAGAAVSIRDLQNAVVWRGVTGADGVVVARDTDLRVHDDWWRFRFVVTAEKDGDVAYVGSDWNDGVEPWSFSASFDLGEATPILRGSVFADRGVYKLGEEVHFKAILRTDTARGIALLPPGTAVKLELVDSRGGAVDTRTLPLGAYGSADWALTLPKDGPLGRYALKATVAGQQQDVTGSLLVAAYRRPDFRVDANLAGETAVAGVKMTGVVDGRYLFGGAMGGRAVRWTLSRTALADAPALLAERYPFEQWVLADEIAEQRFHDETVQQKEDALDAKGQLELQLATDKAAGVPVQYTLEGEVTDVSRQAIAGRASFRVEPAPWYVAFRRPAYFADVKAGVDTEVAAVDLSGKLAAGVPVHVTLTQVQWHSVRRAEGGGFYTWDTERKEVPAGEWDVVTQAAPVPLHVPIGSGGYFVLRATAKDTEGRSNQAATSLYVLGAGYTAWERYDHNRIDLVPEKKTYRPGEQARVMIKSPWEKATALLTTEREGIRTYRLFDLTSTQQTISVPVGEQDIPNVFVSVLLLRGRVTQPPAAGTATDEASPDGVIEDSSDPGKPAFKLGYVELKVEDAAKRLSVSVKADKPEYRPASRARLDVNVKDAAGKPAQAEVTLWAVDYGVLSLTGYKTPDVLGSVYAAKALQVLNENSRQNIVSRRVVVPKGGDEGGGGGAEAGPGTPVRRDFRVLAFWLGSVVTDAKGHALAQVTLPESLTTYRVMAVANDAASRFGRGEQEIRLSKPVLLTAAFPRFMTTGDKASFGAVVHSQLKSAGTAIVTMRSLDPAVLAVAGEPRQAVSVPAKGAVEVRFPVSSLGVGSGRLQMTVKLSGETDAFEDAFPVRAPLTPETTAAYGQATGDAHETLVVPKDVAPGVGGLHLETASTALVGLGEGARYLVDYPYGCAEQRASAALALSLAADLGDAFRLPGVDAAALKTTVADTFKELEAFQCEGGGFAYWKGQCQSQSPYLTSYVAHVYQRGRALGYATNARTLDTAYDYLEKQLAEPKPVNEGWWPAYTSWQAFAVKVLAEGGRNVDSPLTRLYGYADRMPVFGLDYLLDAMTARKETGARPEDIERRIANAVLPEAGTAHVEELSDPYLLYFWNSNVRSTALTLGTLVRRGASREQAPAMARWLLQVRKNGRWGNTQENATAMEALVDYYRAYEKDVPDMTAIVSLGTSELVRQEFHGRSTTAQTKDVPMRELATRAAGAPLDLTVHREGTGTVFYTARLRYALEGLPAEPNDQGFRIERSYAPAAEGAAPAETFKAGDLVRVTLTVRVPKERRFVAVDDPIPAGFEPVESWFATTASALARSQEEEEDQNGDWTAWWRGGGFDHVERHDDRVLLFATRLAAGEHAFSYVVRATTSGAFRTGPTHAEEMYAPEVFGRTPGRVITVSP